MKKFSLITTIIFVLTGCCLAGFGGRGWKNNPNMKPVIDAVCDVNKRPDETQWTNLLNCIQDNKQSDPRRKKFAEMVRIVKLHKRISKLPIHRKNILSIITGEFLIFMFQKAFKKFYISSESNICSEISEH
jgi:hypothetical protein